jgi:hypothetical protein
MTFFWNLTPNSLVEFFRIFPDHSTVSCIGVNAHFSYSFTRDFCTLISEAVGFSETSVRGLFNVFRGRNKWRTYVKTVVNDRCSIICCVFSWLAEKLCACTEGLCCMDLISYLHTG